MKLGVFRPILTFASVDGQPQAELPVGLLLCERHAEQSEAHHYVDATAWDILTEAFKAKGLAPPDRATLRVRYDRA